MKKPHVLLLTADAGFGHRAASQAVADALEDVSGGACQVTTLNLTEHSLVPLLLRLPERQYDLTVNLTPQIYELTYWASDTRLASLLVGQVMTRGLFKASCQVLDELRPDAVLSTYPTYQGAVLAARARIHPKIPFFAVVTDLADVHQMWLQSAPDLLFVPTEAVRQQAVEQGRAARRVIVSGIPVNPQFASQHRPVIEIRTGLGWDIHLPVVLVVGSQRMPHLIDSLAAVNMAQLPVQLAIIAGGDDDLYQQLQAIDWRIPAHLYNYVSTMPEMLSAADVLVSKAGGLITSEALACGLPLVLIDHIPGQETGNLEYVVNQGAGVAAETPELLVQTLQTWFAGGGAVMRQYAGRARELGRPQAANTIATYVWKAASSHAQVVTLRSEWPIQRSGTTPNVSLGMARD